MMAPNILGHDVTQTWILDIEADDLTVTHDPLARVYLIGVMNVHTEEYQLYKSVDAFKQAHLPRLMDGHHYIIHNASFDVPALRLRGFDVPQGQYYCTMVGSHTLNPESSEYHSLGELQPDVKRTLREVLSLAGVDFHGVRKGAEYAWYGNNVHECVDACVEEYLLRDLTATRREYLRQVQEYSVSTPANKKLVDVLLTVNMPYVERIISMEQGVRVQYNGDVADTLREATRIASETCFTTVGYIPSSEIYSRGTVPYTRAGFKSMGEYCKLVPFNPNSNKQVADALIRLYGWEPKEMTKGGQPCTSAEVLEALDYPLCGALLDYGKSSKLLTFCDNLVDRDWVRPSYNQCATRTTRLSCSGPNIQQIPSKDATGKLLRKMFVPRDGYTFLVGDQSGSI